MKQDNDKNYILATNNHLETKRLLLRPVSLLDAEDMFEYSSDSQTTKFVFEPHQTLTDTRYAIAEYFMADPLGKYAIELKEQHKMIGTIDLRAEIKIGVAELGYIINKNYWGFGYIPEACDRLLTLGFVDLNLVRVKALHDQRNQNSGRVMEKIGMTVDSIVPEARRNLGQLKGELFTEVTRSISKKQWQTAKY
ncbi:GNAT family N-acetyltransferase [Tetragenococcus osmophilus]|uniref:N-acetyltransferase n=1 Tax=Tetragenococcus osmophilus TaxID=526944 RepID=A0AA38CVZ1_9ENTE|nr:GNAT family N-acetyltransferase [Tetragenococcus osmophilus]AYW47926.1 GNAT family N-acetyltransferase [Tetragenococcus osmophilus]GMA53634.1 N-acetyltransferase [Alicyclobacillus contaminans]GMA72428.1 N-acetyltransferase [Tetragenococcus osmophilus]